MCNLVRIVTHNAAQLKIFGNDNAELVLGRTKAHTRLSNWQDIHDHLYGTHLFLLFQDIGPPRTSSPNNV